MKRKRYSVEQIVAVLKQAELGMPVADVIRHCIAPSCRDNKNCHLLNLQIVSVLGLCKILLLALMRDINNV